MITSLMQSNILNSPVGYISKAKDFTSCPTTEMASLQADRAKRKQISTAVRTTRLASNRSPRLFLKRGAAPTDRHAVAPMNLSSQGVLSVFVLQSQKSSITYITAPNKKRSHTPFIWLYNFIICAVCLRCSSRINKPPQPFLSKLIIKSTLFSSSNRMCRNVTVLWAWYTSLHVFPELGFPTALRFDYQAQWLILLCQWPLNVCKSKTCHIT